LNEDDLFKRALWAYVFMTVTLWFMSWAMQANGAAYVRNPAWQLISGLRNIFTWGAVIGVGGWISISILAYVQCVLAEKDNEVREARKRRQDALEAEEARLRLREQERIEARRQAQENREREREHRERLQEEQVKRRQRSTEDAAKSALDEF
jgi:hypothetical protein